MFEEFEVVCPKCEAILRLSANGYINYIEEGDFSINSSSSIQQYDFICLDCDANLILEIKVKLKS